MLTYKLIFHMVLKVLVVVSRYVQVNTTGKEHWEWGLVYQNDMIYFPDIFRKKFF